MKKIALYFSLILIGLISLDAKPVDVIQAQQVAERFLLNNSGKSTSDLKLVVTRSNAELPLIYIFSSKQLSTYILVSADDIARPILGYSLESEFSLELIPDHLNAWLSDYEKNILWGIQNHIQATEDIQLAWDQLRNNVNIIGKRAGSVSPILKAKWNQTPYYNDMCPLDGNKRSVVGCVATAMAQVIHYWQYPVKGSGFYSYSHNTLGTISANFGNTTYNYANMPSTISSKNNDVALLSFHCGVSVEMNYSASSSGAYVISSASPVTNCAEYSLKKYFNYPSSVNGQERDNYTTTNWINKVNSDLDKGRPIIYAGFGNGGGHAFVFDGYDNSGKYHVNWGWGGVYNGYFEIDALDPAGLGTGGGSGSFNSGHQAIFGVEAPDNTQTEATISIYANLGLSASSISYGTSFTITTKAANVSGKDFSGSLAIAVFDDSFNFVEFIDETNNVSLQHNYALNSLSFTSTGSLSMLPGKYHLYLCYKNNGGEWQIADDYSAYTNHANLTVYYHSDIELYADLKVTSGTIRNGETATVTFSVANTGSLTFKGTYAVGLYNMDGSFAQELGSYVEKTGLPSGSYYTSGITLTSPTIAVEPGTYLMAVQYQETGSSDWDLAGSYYKVNPIKVIVEAISIKPDPYESNNDVANAYKLNVNYSGNTGIWSSNITNLHQESDVDYFKIEFEKDYVYTLEVKLSDMNKSFSAKTFTLDSRFALSDDGVFWSQAYSNEMPNALTVNGSLKSYVLIRVVPAFAGLLGDYDLTINMTKESTAAVGDLNRQFAILPNPANDYIQVFAQANEHASKFEIFQSNGASLLKGDLDSSQKIKIDTLNSGVYFLKLTTHTGIQTIKFIKE